MAERQTQEEFHATRLASQSKEASLLLVSREDFLRDVFVV